MIYEKHCIPIGADQIALHRFYTCKTDVPVLLLHGSIENGKIFFTKGGKGLAPYLSQLGFDVYVPDMRGKGESVPKISSKHNHSQFEQITVDIPKYLEKIQNIRPFTKIHFGAHSWGGVLLLAYLARFNDARVCSMVLFRTKHKILLKTLRKKLFIDFVWSWLGRFAIHKKGYFPAKDWKLGAENEPKQFYLQTDIWLKSNDWIDSVDGFNYKESILGLNLPPTLYINGIKDFILGNHSDVQALIAETGANQNTQTLLIGKRHGNLANYGHIDMLTHPKAPFDHFPAVVEWFTRFH